MKKWMKWAIAITMITDSALYVSDRNWQALLWIVCCAVWVWVAEIQDKIIKNKDDTISYLEKHPSWLMCLDAERRAERYKDDLARALKNMVRLKEANKMLNTLNKNLLHNQGKGVKNYAKHAKRRDDQD